VAEAELERDVVELIRAAGVPGCAIATTNAAGRSTTRVFGHASLAPERAVSARSRFHLFSGTKLYTAAAVMLLVERGDVALDDPISRHLPELPLRHAMTIRELASHQSGLPDTLRAFLAVHPGERPGPTTAEALARYRVDQGGPPRSGAAYRNVNYAILGELVSRVSGQPFEAFVAEGLLAPLGADLRFDHAGEDTDERVVGHVPRWSPMRLALRLLMPELTTWIYAGTVSGFKALRSFGLDTAAAGGLIGPAEAYLPFLREMLSRDDGMLRAASKETMLTLQSRGAAGIMSREGVGIGWKLGRANGIDFWNHEGGGPGFCSESRLYPGDDLGIVILMNRSQSAALSRVCHRICERLRAGP
jgi:D-alanyl-D-alanine carboxypeptidase